MGREAIKLCDSLELVTDEITNPRFRKVKMYPKSVLVQIFNNPI